MTSAAPVFSGTCRAQRVLSLDAANVVAQPEVTPLAAPDVVAARSSSPATERVDLRLVAAAIFATEGPERTPTQVDVCSKPDRFGHNYETAVRSDSAQIFDVKRVVATGSATPFWMVLYSRDALKQVIAEGTAKWYVALLDRAFHRVTETSFDTERPAERTLDGVGAFLKLEHGLVQAHVAFGCGAKYGERFDVPIRVSTVPVCAHATHEPYPPAGYPRIGSPRSPCVAQPVSNLSAKAVPSYEATHGSMDAWWAMPYVADDVAALDGDWTRVAMILMGGTGGRRVPAASAARVRSAAVGSARHTTSRWSYVTGDELRLHQLLPVKDAANREGYLALSSRLAPREVIANASPEFRVTLLSPGYEPEAEVVFATEKPAATAGTYRAFQTDLELHDGQPLAQVRYLTQPPALAGAEPSGRPDSTDASFDVPLVLDLASVCLARGPRP